MFQWHISEDSNCMASQQCIGTILSLYDSSKEETGNKDIFLLLYRKLLEFGVRLYVGAKRKEVKIFIALVPFLPGN